jgi:hypothetical protein
MSASVTTCRHRLPGRAVELPPSPSVACRAGRDVTPHGGRGRVQRWHGKCSLKETKFLSPEEIARAAQLEHRSWYMCFVAEPMTLSSFVSVEKMGASSMTPWRVTEEHRPPDNIQRSRKEVYRQSSILRHPLN